MVHAFFDADGVRYANRFVRTPKFLAEQSIGGPLLGAHGLAARNDIDVSSLDAGLANTSLVFHGGRLFALEELHAPFRIAL